MAHCHNSRVYLLATPAPVTSRHATSVLLLLQDLLEYKSKLRRLRIKTMDESVKTMFVDDSLPVSQLMVTICSKMGASVCVLLS